MSEGRVLRPGDIKGVRAVARGEAGRVEFDVLVEDIEPLSISRDDAVRGDSVKSAALAAVAGRDRSVDRLSPVAARMLDAAVVALKNGEVPGDSRFSRINFSGAGPDSTDFTVNLSPPVSAEVYAFFAEFGRVKKELLMIGLGLYVSPESLERADYPQLCAAAGAILGTKAGDELIEKVFSAADRFGAERRMDVALSDRDLECKTPLPGETPTEFRIRVAGERSRQLSIKYYALAAEDVMADIGREGGLDERLLRRDGKRPSGR